MLYLRNSNQMQSLADNISGVQRGALPNITASVTSSCIDYEGSGVIDINDIVGGKGPLYNYSLYDLSSSVFITQSTTISSASIEDLNNSTYLVKIDNLGLFAYTQSVSISCPPPPDLEVEYLIVGGGGAGRLAGIGGSAGGFVSASASIPWRTTLNISVGLGGTSVINPQSSSISSSTFGYVYAGGATGGNSGDPQNNDEGISGPGGTQGGGAGAGADGNSGVEGQNGDGGDGLLWLNGLYYAGGGGGTGNPDLPTNPGYPGLGGGGTALFPGESPDGLPYQLNGYNGRGGGAAGTGTSGGSGITIIRYSTGSVRPAFGGETEISGGYVYHTFTGSAEFTYSPQ